MLYQDDLLLGRLNFLKTGILYAGALSTVSRTHAREIQSERYGMGLEGLLRGRSDHLIGIVNGIDYDEWNPATDPHLPHHFDADHPAGKAEVKRHLLQGMGLRGDETNPLVGIISRLTSQKGFDLCFDVLPAMLRRHPDLRIVVLGNGERRYEEFFAGLQAAHQGRVGFYRGYHNPLAHLIEAGSDIFLMPSLYEPCGLNQMYSQRYGTAPVVRRTGGLADTVQPFDPGTGDGTGFVFEHFTPQGLEWALEQALEFFADRRLWSRLVDNAMRQDFSWERQIERYVALYRALAQGRL
jgi:starch synthase